MAGGVRPRILAGAVGLALIAGILPTSGAQVAEAAAVTTGFYRDSVPGDGIGPGIPVLWPQVGWSLTSVDEGGIYAIGMTAFGPGMGEWVDMEFTAPPGGHLVPGNTYSGGVSMSPVNCTIPDGSGFTLHEMTGGVDRSLAISFWIQCSLTSPRFVGELRLASAVPFRALTATPIPVDLGSALVGSTVDMTTVTINSVGNEALATERVTTGPAGTDFSVVSETCTTAPVEPGATCDVVVRFAPTVGGRRTGSLVIDDDTTRGLHVIPLTGIGTLPTSAVAWGTTRAPAPTYTWSAGGALVRTVTTGSSGYLHAISGTDRVSSRWVTDSGPYAGVIYTRSGNGGSTWTSPVRLNPSTQHGDQARIAAYGKLVAVAWTSEKRWVNWSGTLARTLYVRVNTNHGIGTWGSIRRLTSLTGRVGTPSIAVYGTSIYVAYTDSATGYVKVAISRDRGATWRTVSLGSTSAVSIGGRFAVPVVAVTGSLVAVSWTANANFAVKARVSTNAGSSWSGTATLTSSATSATAIATAAGRVGVAWAAADGVKVRIWKASTWGSVRTVGIPTAGRPYEDVWWPALALSGTSGVGIAFPSCWADCDEGTSAMRTDLLWAESKNNGVAWYAPQLLVSAASSSSRRVNYDPSIAWYGTTRAVSWTGETPGTISYRVYLRTGIGAP